MFPHSNDPSMQRPTREELAFVQQQSAAFVYKCTSPFCDYRVLSNDNKLDQAMTCRSCNQRLMIDKSDADK